jgi:hypothetical protein
MEVPAFGIGQVQACHRRIAEPGSIREDHVKDRFLVIARPRDYLQDLPRCRLALQRILKRTVITNLSFGTGRVMSHRVV